MRKGRDGGKTGGKKKREKTDENSGHYVIASSRPPDRRPLERRTLAPKIVKYECMFLQISLSLYGGKIGLFLLQKYVIFADY